MLILTVITIIVIKISIVTLTLFSPFDEFVKNSTAFFKRKILVFNTLLETIKKLL